MYFLQFVYIHFQALNGFLLVVTQDFNVLYVSETIQNYLGYPQVGGFWQSRCLCGYFKHLKKIISDGKSVPINDLQSFAWLPRNS